MALGSLYTIEIQLAKRKKICQIVLGLQKMYYFLGFFNFFFTTDFSKCLIELTNLTYGFGIMQTCFS